MISEGGVTPFCNRVVQIKKSLFHDNPQQQQQHEPGTLLDLSATAAGKNGRVNKGGILTAKTKLQATC